MPKPIFVAATRQHVGKTTVSLALMSGLQKRFDKVGFIKPVGQQHIPVMNSQGKEIRVDKDVQVMKEFFSLDHIEYADMSPVIIPKGYTSRYIDSEINSDAQVEAIRRSFAAQSAVSDAVLVEGTGHVGVGSIVELSNAKAAALVGADVVLVTNGGLGKAFDELEMNRQMFANEGVKVRGVVLNKVMPHKVVQVREKMGKVMMERWGIPLLGVVPDLPYLGSSSLRPSLNAALGSSIANPGPGAYDVAGNMRTEFFGWGSMASTVSKFDPDFEATLRTAAREPGPLDYGNTSSTLSVGGGRFGRAYDPTRPWDDDASEMSYED